MAATASAAAPAATAAMVTRGIKGAIKQRLRKEMIDKVPGAMKVLIIDEASTNILNVAMRMSDLMDSGITLVENVMNKRQPVRTCPAIYFLSPTEASVTAMINDWETGTGNYASANVFFTTTCPEPLIRRIGGSRMRPKLQALSDLYIDFCVPETLTFHFAMARELTLLFGGQANANTPTLIAGQLCNVFRCMEDFPAIRVYGTGTVAANIGQLVNDRLQNDVRAHPDQANKGSVVLILDRSFDVVQPFFHDLTYQAAVNDIMPFKNGIVTVPPADTSKGAKAKDHIIDEEDPVWARCRHLHFVKLASTLQQKLDTLYASNPMVAKYEKNGAAGLPLSDVAEVLRVLPAFQAQKEKIALHMKVNEELSRKVTTLRLDSLSPLEVKIVTGEASVNVKLRPADLLNELQVTLKDPAIAMPSKVRLLALYCATWGTDKLDVLARDAGMTDFDKLPITNLAVLQPWTPEKKNRVKKSVANPNDDSDTGRYEPYIKTVLLQLLNDTLPVDTFPALGSKVSAKVVAKAAATSRFAAGKPKQADFGLDIAGEVTPLVSPARVFVFVAGGFTLGEARCIYEVAKEQGREIIIGGTSVLRPDSLIADLCTTTPS